MTHNWKISQKVKENWSIGVGAKQLSHNHLLFLLFFVWVLLWFNCGGLLLLRLFIVLFRHKSVLQARCWETVFCKVSWKEWFIKTPAWMFLRSQVSSKRLSETCNPCVLLGCDLFTSFGYHTFAAALWACCVKYSLQSDPVARVISKLPTSSWILPAVKHSQW